MFADPPVSRCANNTMKSPLPTSLARYRWILAALLFGASFFNYFDRQTVSVLKTTLKGEFQIDDAGYALVVNAFTFCYAVAWMVSGYVVDRIGGRVALTMFVIVWSVATVFGGLATSFWFLIAMRALLGLAEPGIHPVILRAAAMWTEEKGRSVFITIASMGGNIATIIAVPAITFIALHTHWRVAFIAPGAAGLMIAFFWLRVYRERSVPEASPKAASSLPAALPPMSWDKLWRQPALWGIVLARLVSDPVWYFCIFWMPGYLQESKGLTMEQLAWVGWIPLLVGNVFGFGYAALSDRVGARGGARGRKRLVTAFTVLSPACLLIPHTQAIPATIAAFSLVAVLCMAWLSSLAPIISATFSVKNVASVWGIAGSFGAAGAIVMNHVVGQASKWLDPSLLFIVFAILHPLAAILLNSLVRTPRTLSPAAAN
jgi:ACS family hexuronate transporter-like MFS transporter